MNAIKRHLGLMMGGVLAVASIWACEATRHSDGSWSIQFAPDMTIHAFGLEDALGKLTDLLNKCITGNFSRPCTSEEMEAINEAIGSVVGSKKRLGRTLESGGSLAG